MAYHVEGHYRSALRTFHDFLVDITAGYAYELQVPISFWRDGLGRLRLWRANIEIYGSSRDFWDDRLCGPSHIKTQVRKILTELEETIRETETVMAEEAQDTNMIGGDGDEDDGDDDPTTELQQLFQYVETLIKCLFKISTLFQNSAAHDCSKGFNSKIMDEINTYVDRQSPPGIEHESHTVASLGGSAEETLAPEEELKEPSNQGQTLSQESADPDSLLLREKLSPHTGLVRPDSGPSGREASSSPGAGVLSRQVPPAGRQFIRTMTQVWMCCSCRDTHPPASGVCMICNHTRCRFCILIGFD